MKEGDSVGKWGGDCREKDCGKWMKGGDCGEGGEGRGLWGKGCGKWMRGRDCGKRDAGSG